VTPIFAEVRRVSRLTGTSITNSRARESGPTILCLLVHRGLIKNDKDLAIGDAAAALPAGDAMHRLHGVSCAAKSLSPADKSQAATDRSIDFVLFDECDIDRVVADSAAVGARQGEFGGQGD
jgi:hypothetical protein